MDVYPFLAFWVPCITANSSESARDGLYMIKAWTLSHTLTGITYTHAYIGAYIHTHTCTYIFVYEHTHTNIRAHSCARVYTLCSLYIDVLAFSIEPVVLYSVCHTLCPANFLKMCRISSGLLHLISIMRIVVRLSSGHMQHIIWFTIVIKAMRGTLNHGKNSSDPMTWA